MAASLSRPDPSSPASVAEAVFSTSRRGFQPDEVRSFLVAVGAELGRLQERERQLEAELREARAAAASAPSQLDEATVTELLGEETVRVLQTARESASQIKIRAEEAAARVLREASDEANRLRQESEVDVARRRQEASADAEAEVALAKQQGREMVNEARAYRERVLADLDRRTTLARKQIEELIHGRDRLLQVFERARLVAVDVTSELRDIDTPDELVNLTPTTGPVPIMVPHQRAQREADPHADTGGETERSSRTPRSDGRDDAPEQDDRRSAPRAASVEPDAVDAEPEAVDAEPVEPEAVEPEPDVVEPEAVESETVDVEDAEPEAVEPEAVEPESVEAEHVADDETVSDEPDEGDGTEAVGRGSVRDDNVVSLFRDRPIITGDVEPTEPDAEIEAGADEAVDDGSGDEVGGIFARLRDELPVDDTLVDATHDDQDELDESVAADTPFTRRDEALVPLIVQAARKMKRVLADEQNLVLDTLRRREPVTELSELVPDVDDHVSSYRQAIETELLGAAVAGAAETGAGDTRTLRNRLVGAGALDEAAALLRTALIGPLRDRLQRSIIDGSGDNDAIAKRIRAVYREWKTQHIDSQLDDVFRFAHGGGIARAVEPGTPMAWTVDPSKPACPDCEDNSLSGTVPAGEPFATGHTAAPAHPGCRCLVVPAN